MIFPSMTGLTCAADYGQALRRLDGWHVLPLGTPLVFFDVDGVLNHEGLYGERLASGRQWPDPAQWIDVECLWRLDALCRYTGAAAVVSSSWRKYLGGWRGVRDVLARVGFTSRIVGGTPSYSFGRDHEDDLVACERWREIVQWFVWHEVDPGAMPWVVIDDVELQGADPRRFVRTSMACGITSQNVIDAHYMLAGKPRYRP